MLHQASVQERAFSRAARIERAAQQFEPLADPWARADRYVANLRRMMEAESIAALKLARQMGVPTPDEDR